MPRYIDAMKIPYRHMYGDILIAEKDMIDAVPTISPDDVRGVGKWERSECEDGKFWANYCSLCFVYLPYGLEWKPNYCPNCGAMLRNGGTDDS